VLGPLRDAARSTRVELRATSIELLGLHAAGAAPGV
jgi:hypothetical protein